MQILQTMVNYNEKTITGMGIHLSKRVNVPTNTELQCLEWNHNTNYIAIGGTNGVMKIVKLADSALLKEGGKQMSNLQVNQTLEGHVGNVQCLTWNEVYQKLTSSDSNGLITVWSLHHDSWYEEMINNRNKSVVVSMAWNADGSKIAIAYEDGQVIVGTSDGNRIWNKDLPHVLAYTEWSPNGELLLFGLQDGEVHLYDSQGTFLSKISITAVESVELETALQKDLKKDQIVALRWWHPIHKSRLLDPMTTIAVPEEGVRGRLTKASSLEFLVPIEQEEEKRPQILIAYSHGVMQMMTSETDMNPATCVIDQFTITCARWSPNGAFIAVSGYVNEAQLSERCCVHIVSAYGTKLAQLRVPGRSLTGVTWDPTGLRVALTVDSAVLLSNIRPYYKWGYCGQTVIYSYERTDKKEFRVIFYETKLEEPYPKSLPKLLHITSYDNYCILVNMPHGEREEGRYYLQLCNSIGTPVDYKYVEVEPRCVAMNAKAAVVAGAETYLVWHFNLPKRTAISVPAMRHLGSDEIRVLELNSSDYIGRKRRASDPINAVCMADDFFIAVTDSGVTFRIGLDGAIQQRFTMPPGIVQMELNCTFRRIAALDTSNTLQFFDLKENSVDKVMWMSGDESKPGKPGQTMDKKDVWSFKWDSDREDSIAYNEKGKMIVMRGGVLEEGVSNMGYICHFKGLTVRTVSLDRFLLSPDNPQSSYVTDIEIKSLRDAKAWLSNSNSLQQAVEYIEKNPHPKLWTLLAEVSLRRLDIEKAELAYVKLTDYCGLQFCKKLANVQNDRIKKADVAAYLGRLEEAEKMYLECDRGDLAIAMYQQTNDWIKVLQLLNKGYGGMNVDVMKQQAYERVGDQYAEKQKWKTATEHYEKARCAEKLMYCFLKLDDYDGLTRLAKVVHNDSPLLAELGFVFGSAGLCDESVDCYVRCGKLKEALDVCIQLNQWAKAESLSREHNLRNIDGLLEKHAAELTGSNERTLAAVQLYRRAGKFLDAAKIVYAIANDERQKMAECLRLKKLYTMAALLVEEYHTHQRTRLAEEKGIHESDASVALSGLLQEDEGVTMEESRMIDGAWRGALAYHFFMMAQKQIYEGQADAAMKTALHLTEYEDLLDPLEIYSLLALSSCANRQFSVCSRAFLKLERMDTDAREEFKELAVKIFSSYPPTDNKAQLLPCMNCERMIPDYSQFCPECDSKFPVCVATGRPLIDYQFWLCPCCHHRAFEQFMVRSTFCPLCHFNLS